MPEADGVLVPGKSIVIEPTSKWRQELPSGIKLMTMPRRQHRCVAEKMMLATVSWIYQALVWLSRALSKGYQ